MDADKDTAHIEKNWQSDTQWIDEVWDQVQGQLGKGADGKKHNQTALQAVNTVHERGVEATWTEEEKLVFKLKRRTAIPLAYHGHLFNDKYSEFTFRVYPVTILDVCSPGFQKITSVATSFQFSVVQETSVVKLHATGDVAKTLMEGILCTKLKEPLVTVEVEQREPDREETDDGGKPYFYPAVRSKAVLKIDTTRVPKNLGHRQTVDVSGDDKQRSLFLRNLPETIGAEFLRILFPACLQCLTAKVSDSVRSAILITQSKNTALHLLASIAEFQVNERTIHMGSAEASKQDADQLIACEKDTRANGMEPGDLNDTASTGVAKSAPGKIPSLLDFIKDDITKPGAKLGVKRKSPSDVRRDKARKQKYEKGKLPLLPPPDPLVSSKPSLLGSPAPYGGHMPVAGHIPPAPPFPDEFRLMSGLPAQSIHPEVAANMHPAPAPPLDEFRQWSTPAAYRHPGALSDFPPAPPFPEELRLLGMVAARREDKIGEGVQHPRVKTQQRIERDRKRMTEFIAKKNKAAGEKAGDTGQEQNSAKDVIAYGHLRPGVDPLGPTPPGIESEGHHHARGTARKENGFLTRERYVDKRDEIVQRDPHYPARDPLHPSRGLLYPPRDSLLPSRGPLYPERDPLYPPRDSLYPSRDPLYPPRDPLYPPRDPLYPSRDPLYPSRDPLYPSRDPLYPPRDPYYRARDPYYRARDPYFSAREMYECERDKTAWWEDNYL